LTNNLLYFIQDFKLIGAKKAEESVLSTDEIMFQSENLMLEAFGTCLPTNRAGELFLQSYMDRKDPN